ncbi:MFS general substrate transporter [Lepidopterella palustris CBS 459.81]|uniref:MFS general substrate transporter n=1 Tax=Lepidopterella palustris CBS 459.81 TaxID=1314670 RepID=A0A8E2JK59_9PEZI|nr:MFS general substrate transporter [Lepidopterella palustris CBS 459.81]
MAKTRQQRSRRRLPQPWKNRIRMFQHLHDFETQKELAYKRIDKDGFGYWTVFTAGAGFLAGAYDIFAVNMITPMLGIVFWNGKMPQRDATSIGLATLVGMLIGQVAVGILGDRYGRKKMYGVLLIIMIVTTVSLALCSRGALNSVNILGWIISWRLLMGAAIGGDYVLSATITAEFAPRRHRAKMLAAVFYAQPVGQLFATIVAIIATACVRRSLSQNASPTDCVGQCLHDTDTIWRWIVGFGAIPPSLAVMLRFYIPESPRYLLEIESDPMGIEAADYLRNRTLVDTLGDEEQNGEQVDAEGGMQERTEDNHETERDSSDFHRIPDNFRGSKAPVAIDTTELSEIQPAYLNTPIPNGEGIPGGSSAPSGSSVPSRSIVVNEPQAAQEIEDPTDPVTPVIAYYDDFGGQGVLRPTQRNSVEVRSLAENSGRQPTSEQNTANNSVIITATPRQNQIHQPRRESWKEFRHGLIAYLSTDGNWTDLAGTAITWCLLDFSFYFLTVNNPQVISKIWDTPAYTNVYPELMQYAWRALVSTCIGAMIGGAIFIAMAKFRHALQFYGFLILSALFVAVGVTFITLLDGRYFAAIIVLYCACNLFFDFGPNTSTFIIPAEVFPTRYRCTCHGISAGAGKLGSIVAQIFLAEAKFGNLGVNDPHSKWLGWALLVNAAVMLAGASVTKAWVPNPCDINGDSRSLEDLGQGKQWRKKMEERERKEKKAADRTRNA